MIYYFSGTGNTRLVAQRLASLLGDQALPIGTTSPPTLSDKDERIGFVFPVYGWDVPPVMAEFIRNVKVASQPSYIYMVCTCGDDIGHTDRRFYRLLAEKDVKCQGAWSILMPDTYIGLPGFDIDPQEEIAQKLQQAEKQIDAIAQHIKQKEQIVSVKNGRFAWSKTYILGKAFHRWLTGEHKFRTTDACNRCGKCAKVCPLNNITMSDSGPTRHGHCADCLACYHHCPKRAIEYGRFSKGKGQYKIPPYWNKSNT